MTNEAGIALLKEFERGKDPDTGKLLPVGVPATKAYNDMPDESGKWTISWGLTGPDIRRGTVWPVSKCEAEFAARVSEFEQDVLAECVVEPNENQLAAMVCLAFNIGMGWKGKRGPRDRDGFRQSTVLRLHNQSDFTGAARAFALWNKAGGQVRAGLTRRRAAESVLYLTPNDDRQQTTRVQAESAPHSSKPNVATIVATAGATLTGVQQVVAQFEGIWNSFHEMGINPHYVMTGLGIAAVVTCGYFIYDAWKRKDD